MPNATAPKKITSKSTSSMTETEIPVLVVTFTPFSISHLASSGDSGLSVTKEPSDVVKMIFPDWMTASETLPSSTDDVNSE